MDLMLVGEKNDKISEKKDSMLETDRVKDKVKPRMGTRVWGAGVHEGKPRFCHYESTSSPQQA